MSKKVPILQISNDIEDSTNETIIEELNIPKKSPLVTRPVSSFAKNIGLSVIKFQYPSISHKQNILKTSVENLKAKETPWLFVWIEDYPATFNDYCRHLLDQKFTKSIKCTFSRSRQCNNHRTMTRINWIHHARRGHIRIDKRWKNILKKSDNLKPEKVFEILCIVCKFGNRPPYLNSLDFVKHMTTYHPHFGPYDDYLAYFRRCVICNDKTMSFQHNLIHRQACLTELVKDVNQDGTEYFNDCFNTQRSMATLSFQLNSNERANFDCKLKEFNSSKNAICHWLDKTKGDYPVTTVSAQNGHIQATMPTTSSLFFLRNNISTSKLYKNCVYDLSDRIGPGATIDEEKIKKFIIPVPFLIKNDPQSKETYTKWRKNIKEEHHLVQSNAPWYCEICNAMLRNVRTAYCHIKMCHPLAGFLDQSCDACEKRFLTVQGYKNHYNGSKNCPVARRCMVCKQSVSISDIYEHMAQKHQYVGQAEKQTTEQTVEQKTIVVGCGKLSQKRILVEETSTEAISPREQAIELRPTRHAKETSEETSERKVIISEQVRRCRNIHKVHETDNDDEEKLARRARATERKRRWRAAQRSHKIKEH